MNKQDNVEPLPTNEINAEYYIWLVQIDSIDISLIANLASIVHPSSRNDYISQQMKYQRMII